MAFSLASSDTTNGAMVMCLSHSGLAIFPVSNSHLPVLCVEFVVCISLIARNDDGADRAKSICKPHCIYLILNTSRRAQFHLPQWIWIIARPKCNFLQRDFILWKPKTENPNAAIKIDWREKVQKIRAPPQNNKEEVFFSLLFLF